MPKFKKPSTALVIKGKTAKSAALLKSTSGSQSQINDAIKGGVKLRKVSPAERTANQPNRKNSGLVDLGNLGMLASKIALERRQRGEITVNRQKRAQEAQKPLMPVVKLRPVKGSPMERDLTSSNSGRSVRPGANRPSNGAPMARRSYTITGAMSRNIQPPGRAALRPVNRGGAPGRAPNQPTAGERASEIFGRPLRPTGARPGAGGRGGRPGAGRPRGVTAAATLRPSASRPAVELAPKVK